MAEPSTLPPSPWNVANALTVLRVVLVPLFGWLLLREGGDDDAHGVALRRSRMADST